MRDLGINRANFRDALGEISESCDIDNVGDSTAMNNISGYVGASQMPFIEELLTKQRENALRWEQYFKSYPGVRLMTKREYVRSSYWTFTILCENRDELLIKLRKKGIYASKVHLRNDLYSVFGNKTLGLEGVNEFSKKQLNLPCGWWITEEDYDF